MSSILQNSIIVVIVIFLGYVGYQMIVLGNTNVLDVSGDGVMIQEDLLNKTQDFITRKQKLNSVVLDTDFLKDPKFTSLRSFSTPVPEQIIGRENIFDEAVSITSATVPPVNP